ncbi:MFS transporter [bacterium]|nr:MFS transporter [bacterium]
MFFLPKDLSESGRMTFRAELEAGIVGSVFVGANALLVVLLKKYFGASLLQLGIFGSISSIAYISAIWLNRLTEQIRARTLIRYAGMVRSLLFILLGFVQTPVGLIVVFGLSQIAYAAIHPAMSRLWKANYNDRERMEVTGSLNAIRSLFEMALAWFITMLFDYNELTFRIIVPLSGICGAVSFLIISRVKLINGDTEDVPPRHKSDRNILVEYYHVLIKNKPLAYFLFLFFFFGSANWIHNVLQVAYLE